ncbi:MAG: class I adenylate-forming enzyme family protein [Caulobacterales bacterium]
MNAFQICSDVMPLGDVLVRAALRYPERKAIVFPDSCMTYSELLSGSINVARGLVAYGVKPGEKIGLLMNSGSEFVTGFFGAALIGCVVVPLNARHKAAELTYIIDNAQLTGIITSAANTSYVDFRKVISSVLPSLQDATDASALDLAEARHLKRIVLLAGESAPGFIDPPSFFARGSGISETVIDAARRRVRVRDIALIIYTSGTTANPKGCMLTHEAIVRGPTERASSRLAADGVCVTWGGGPLFHIGTLSPFVGCLGAGGTYLTDEYFDAGRALKLMAREGVTLAFPWFPAMIQALLEHPDFQAKELSTLRHMLLIGPETLIDRVQSVLPQTDVLQACGMTETAGIFAISEVGESRKLRTTTQGKPVPGIDVRIASLTGEGDAAPDEIGEILVRGYCVMEGYYRDPAKTAEALDEGGWLHTGDLYAMSPEGNLTFNGRLKDMLKVGGENVAALEIEAFLARHPAVRIAEVVGRPDVRLDEVPVAFVELRPGHAATEEELIAHCRGQIANYKVPRAVFFMKPEQWPMSATKVDKRALRLRVQQASA